MLRKQKNQATFTCISYGRGLEPTAWPHISFRENVIVNPKIRKFKEPESQKTQEPRNPSPR